MPGGDTPPAPVFADVDTGVDDAMALVYLLSSPDADLVGIAATGGNIAVDRVCLNTLGLLELSRQTRIPVSKGVESPLRGPMRTAENIHGPHGLGYAELAPRDLRPTTYDAASAWVRTARAHPGRLIAVATGPLTNLALALRAEPELPALLHRLVIMGCSFNHRGTTGVTEFNTGVDPDATAEVFAAWETQAPQRLPIVCGLELTEHAAMTPAVLGELAMTPAAEVMNERQRRGTRSAAANPLIRVLEDAMRFYFETHHDRGHGYLAYLHDPLAAAVALDPSLLTSRPAAVSVELADTPARGRTTADPPHAAGVPGHRQPNAQIGVDVDAEVFFDRFVERVGAFARRLG